MFSKQSLFYLIKGTEIIYWYVILIFFSTFSLYKIALEMIRKLYIFIFFKNLLKFSTNHKLSLFNQWLRLFN
jgi:hypothetical protein